MTLRIQSILGCLFILATASDIYTQEIKQVGGPKELVAPTDKTILLGTGVELTQLPIVTYSLQSTKVILSFYIQPGKKCENFTFWFGTVKSVDIRTVKQLNDDSIALVWSRQTNKHFRTVSVFDVGKCTVKDHLDWELSPSTILVVVPYVNGFDVITSKNNRASYGNDAKLIGQVKSFPINSASFDISAASGATPTKGFFVADYFNSALTLIKEDGTSGKPLLKFPTAVFSNNEQSLHSICWFEAQVVANCVQYDEAGNKKWNKKITLKFGGKLDMKNLVGGGLVFVALNRDGNQFSFVEMGPTLANQWSYLAQQKFKAVRLMGFSKQERTFVLAYESSQTKQVLSQTFKM